MIFNQKKIRTLTSKLEKLEKRVLELEKLLEQEKSIINTNIIRLRNGYELNDQAILDGSKYMDITAYKAYEIFQLDEAQYTVLDIASQDFARPCKIPSLITIPYSELNSRIDDIPTKTIPILVISEDGVNSINACELLSQHGFYNTYNISGGYEKLPTPKIDGLGQTLD